MMTNTDIKLLLFGGISTIGGLIFGLRGVLSRKKINKKSDFCMSVNILLTGIAMAIFLVFFLFFRITPIGLSMMSEKRFDTLGLIWLAATFFVYGIHGVVNKKRINNPMFFQFCLMGLIGSLILAIGTVLTLYRWGWPK